jgi:DNA-binding CsgD family transcriptional regulator
VHQCLDLLGRLAAARVGFADYVTEARPAVRRAIGFDGWCLGMADPRSRLPNAAAVHDAPLGDRLPEFWRFEFDRSPVHGHAVPLDAVLAAAARHDPLGRRRYEELLRRGGVGDELRIPLVAERTYWGSLALFRSAGGPAFTEAEISAATVLMPALTAGVRGAWAATARIPGTVAAGEPGTMLLGPDGAIVGETPQAHEWLARLGPRFGQTMLSAVLAMLDTRLTTSVRTRTADGLWVHVSAGRLTPAAGPATIAVTLQSAGPAEITPLLLRAYGLTPRQRVVARLLLAGHSSQQVARALHLSPHTVNDHVRAIEARVGVHSRTELSAVLGGQSVTTGSWTAT